MLLMETEVDRKKLVSILHYNGLPISADFIVQSVEDETAKGRAA